MGQINCDTGQEPKALRVRGMYFSGTGTTETIVRAVAAGLAGKFAQTDTAISAEKSPDIDFTPPDTRMKAYRFDDRDIIVFGVPVIAGRVPNVLLPFLSTLEGDGAIAIPVVLYGNRNFDDALIELRDILEEQGFHTIAAAAFIGEHSFSRILAAGRPDEKDLGIAEQFAAAAGEKLLGFIREAQRQALALRGGRDPSPEQILEQLRTALEDAGPVPVEGEEPLRPYYKPRDRQGNFINILKVKPKLNEAKCTKCGICADICPMGSIAKDAPGIVSGICIKCCGCEKKCPEGALYFDDPGYLYHKEELELGYPQRKEPALFL